MELLKKPADRKVYESEIDEAGFSDLDGPYEFEHWWPEEESIEYPCLVQSVFIDNPLGIAEYHHFVFDINDAYHLVDQHERLDEHGDS